MKDVETILKALNTFDGYDAILYDANTGNMVRFQDVVDFITWQKAEIERLTVDLNLSLDINRTIEGIGKQVGELLGENEKLLKENAELQKQVDVLKEQNMDLQLDKQDLLNKISEHENAYKRLDEAYVNLNNLYQQAGKETAKKYHDMMNKAIVDIDYYGDLAEVGMKNDNDDVYNKIMEGVNNE